MLAWKGGARTAAKQSKTEEGRRAAYFERRRRELADVAGEHQPADAAVREGGLAPPHAEQQEEPEESYDVLQLRFLVELVPAPAPEAGAAHSPSPAAHPISAHGALLLTAPAPPARPAASDLRGVLERSGASDFAGSLGGVAPSPQPLLAERPIEPTWCQQPASPPRAAARYFTSPPRKPAAALDLRYHQLASFSPGGDEPEPPYRREPMVAMPSAPAAAAPAPALQLAAEAAAASPERTECSWLVETAKAGAAVMAAGQGFRTPPRTVWAGSDDEAEAERLDAAVSRLLERGDSTPQALMPQSDFSAFAAGRRAALRPGDAMAHDDAFQHGGGGFAAAEHGGNGDAAVRMQRSYTQHTGGSWPMLVTTEERLEVSFFPPHAARHSHMAYEPQRPATAGGCRITECDDDDDDDDGMSDLGMLLAQRGRGSAGGDADQQRSFHLPPALLGGAADSPAEQRAEQAAAARAEPSQLMSPLSPQLSSPCSPAGDGGGDDASAWAAAARFARQLNAGVDAAASPKPAGAAADAAERAADQPGCPLAAPAAPADVAAAPAETPPAAARETSGARQLRAALAAQEHERETAALAELKRLAEAAEYTAQLESAVLQLLLCKAAAQQGEEDAAGSGWLCGEKVRGDEAETPPAVARC